MLTKVDVNKDGEISFVEFFFFLLLLQIPASKLRKSFKKHGGQMTKDEFSSELRSLRKLSSAGKKQQDKVQIDARAIKASEKDFLEANKSLCNILFQDKQSINYEDILELREDFREDLWNYEFHSYEPDEKTGKIPMEAFLRSLSVCLHGNKVEKYLRRIKKVVAKLEQDPHFKDAGVSLEEFIAFQYFLDNIDSLRSKLNQFKYLDYDMYREVFENFSKHNDYCKEKKVAISDVQMISVFNLVDTDDSGELEPEEILGVFMDRK